MRTQLIAALAVAAVTSGCGLMGTESTEPSQRSGEVTVGDKSRQTRLVKCTQNQWSLSIEATTDPGRTRAYLQLGGVEPKVRTVSIENIDGLYGIAGGDVGTAEASTEGNSVYKITGTAVVSDPANNPGTTTEMPFSIEVPC
ncbi:MAG: lipoprotein LpqH [Mycobacterium sp.]